MMSILGPGSIGGFFSGVSDPRMNRTKRHSLSDILVLSILAVIGGADDWVTIQRFGEAKLDWLKSFLELDSGIPSHDTLGRVFAALNPQEFTRCFTQWMSSLSGSVSGGVIAIDGKAIRGSFDKALGKGAIHMVSAWSSANSLVLGQYKVDDKSNEITAIPKLIALLDLQGATVTIDAIGTQKNIAKTIIDAGANYILTLKGNQGNLHEDAELLFGGATQEILAEISSDTFQTIDGDHGRIETRTHWLINDLTGLSGAENWTNLSSLGIVERQRDTGSKITNERTFFLVSEENLAAKDFAAAIRSHWSIENSLHWMLDVSFGEDASRVRVGNAAENFSTIRKIALALLKNAPLSKGGGIKTRRLAAGWDHSYLLRVLGYGDKHN